MARTIAVVKKKYPPDPETPSRGPLQDYISFLQRIFKPASSQKQDKQRSA